MVIRCVVGGSRDRPSLRSFSQAAALLLCAVTLPAQQPVTQPKPAATPVEGTPVAAEPVAVELVFGKIVAETAPLRCWSSAVAAPPVFEDVLKKDQVVHLGHSQNGFRAVVLPLGPIGYVSKRFSVMAEDGTVTTKGSKVAFRYRPRTTEAPVAQLADGTAIHVVGEKENWYRVRVTGIEAWVAAAEVQVVDAADPLVLAAYEELEKQMRGEAQARLDAIAAEQQRSKQDKIELEAVGVVEAAFKKELAKPAPEQQFAALTGALDKLVETLAEDSQARVAVAGLKKRIETQQWIAEAMVVQSSKPPVDDTPKPAAAPVDPLKRFESIGWLRYERHLAGPGVFYLEKGGRRIHLLSCKNGRYDLALFVGREVGVIGPRRQPPTATMSVLDVERVEVLGSTKR